LSAERKEELAETGKLKNMDGHHEPSISSGKTVEDKVEIAQNPDNITFMEKSDHQALHGELGGTQVPITVGADALTKGLLGVAAGLEVLSEIADYVPDPSMIFQPTELGCATLTECK
jgi:hypothetical protein